MTIKEMAIVAAHGAGKILRENMSRISDHDIEDKTPFDFVTVIDKESERYIIDMIHDQFPEHEILAEESGETKGSNAHRWIIDPLDGTTNYIHGYPNIAVSLAFEKKGEICLGVIYDPFRDEMFYAEKGKGAFLNDERIAVSQRQGKKYCLVATGFPFKNRDFLDRYWKVLAAIFMEVSGIRRTGSAALDLAHIACGRFDGFFELKLCPWDVAAGSLIIAEAGGCITDFEGGNRFIQCGNVIASNGLIHPFILQKVQSVFCCNP